MFSAIACAAYRVRDELRRADLRTLQVIVIGDGRSTPARLESIALQSDRPHSWLPRTSDKYLQNWRNSCRLFVSPHHQF